MDLQDKKIGILGLGEENIALIKYLSKIGCKKLTVCDRKSEGDLDNYLSQIKDLSLEYVLSADYLKNLNSFDVVFRTPGLAYFTPEIQQAKADGVEISSQTKLFFEKCPARIIGVTGTKGKGTTSTLIYEILKSKFDKKVFLGGNIGNAPINFLDELTSEDLVILELSSFQLQDLEKSPNISVILNIASDHLDVHKNREEYVEAKTNIVRHQAENDFACVNQDYLTSFEFAALTKSQVYFFSRQKSVDRGVWVKDKKEIVLRENDLDSVIAMTSEITLRGEHNWENIAAASLASYLAGANLEDISNIVKSFKGLEHRLEFVSEIDGVKFYNDSFSTTPETAIAAIQSFSEPIVLISGGSEKHADYKELGRAIGESNVKTAILIGETGPRIKNEIKNPNIEIISNCHNIQDVVRVAKEKSSPGDVVLLSPASASFDWFANYKDRGKKFKENVVS